MQGGESLSDEVVELESLEYLRILYSIQIFFIRPTLLCRTTLPGNKIKIFLEGIIKMSKLPNPNSYPMSNLCKEKQFAYIYGTASYSVQPGQDVPLDQNGPMTDKIIHNYGSSVIIIKQTCMYKLTYVIVSESSNNQIAVAVNNRIIYDSLYGAEPSMQNYGQLVLYLREGDVISLRNIDGVLTLPALTYDNFNIVNVSVILETMNFSVAEDC